MLRYTAMAINTKCNNSCIWCYGKANQMLNLEMSDQIFDATLSLLKQANCKRLIFLGGEPTLHSKLSDFVHKSAMAGFDLTIVSNGSHYSDGFLADIEDVKEKITLNVSIEGATAETHDKITKKKGSFNKLLNGIKSAKKRKFNIAAILTLCSVNMHELEDVINLLENMQFDAMLINFANPPLNVFCDNSIYLTVNKFSEQIAISVKNIAYSMDITVGPSLPLCQLSPMFKEMINEKKIHLNNGCQLLFGKAITIDPIGNILLCNHLTEVTTGNINDIANIKEFQLFLTNLDIHARKELQKYPLKKCNKCKESTTCFGGCPLLWLK